MVLYRRNKRMERHVTVTISDYSVKSNASPSLLPNKVITIQQSTQNGVLFGFNWEQIAIVLSGMTVIVLAVLLVFSRKRSKKAQCNS